MWCGLCAARTPSTRFRPANSLGRRPESKKGNFDHRSVASAARRLLDNRRKRNTITFRQEIARESVQSLQDPSICCSLFFFSFIDGFLISSINSPSKIARQWQTRTFLACEEPIEREKKGRKGIRGTTGK